MSEKPKSPTETGQQLNEIMAGLADPAAWRLLGEAMNDSVASGTTRYKESLTPPQTDGFGTFKEKYHYLEGCVISAELVKRVAEISFKTKTSDGVNRIIGIGATPTEWDPTAGGKVIADAGEPSALLMVIAKTEADGTSSTNYRYLDAIDVEGVRVAIGEPTMLGENQDRARQIQIPGEVTEVAGFIAQ